MSADLWKKRKQLWQPPHFWGFKVWRCSLRHTALVLCDGNPESYDGGELYGTGRDEES